MTKPCKFNTIRQTPLTPKDLSPIPKPELFLSLNDIVNHERQRVLGKRIGISG